MMALTKKIKFFKDEINYALGNIIQNAIVYSKFEINNIFKNL